MVQSFFDCMKLHQENLMVTKTSSDSLLGHSKKQAEADKDLLLVSLQLKKCQSTISARHLKALEHIHDEMFSELSSFDFYKKIGLISNIIYQKEGGQVKSYIEINPYKFHPTGFRQIQIDTSN